MMSRPDQLSTSFADSTSLGLNAVSVGGESAPSYISLPVMLAHRDLISAGVHSPGYQVKILFKP